MHVHSGEAQGLQMVPGLVESSAKCLYALAGSGL